MMILGLIASPLGSQLGGWRHPEAWPTSAMRLDNIIATAKLAEHGELDFIFVADGNGVRQMDKPALFAANNPSARPTGFEPLTMSAAVSQHTKHVGFVATATTTYEEPYLIAQKFASLDHISGGRVAWNVVTTSYAGDALNFSHTEHVARDTRYERARESLEIVRSLWDSWAEDAFVQDKATGQYLDPTKVHTLNHVGKYFSVQGPLNVARPPQGHPVLFMAGQSELGREFAAKTADGVFAVTDTKAAGQEFYADVKGRLARYGRAPDSMRIMPGCSVYVGRTAAEADELFEELQSLIAPELCVPYLSKMVNMNLEGMPLDGPMPDLSAETNAIASFRNSIAAMAKRDNLTIHQTYDRVLPSMGHTVLKGSGKQVADQMKDWYTSQACDGFNVLVPVLPRGLTDFVDLVVPELQRRRLFRAEYQGRNLREIMGLPVPKNPNFNS